MTFPPEVWTGVLRRLREELPPFTFEAWIAPLAIGEASGGRVVVLCPTVFHRDRVRATLREPIAAALGDALGKQPNVDFDVVDADAAEPGPTAGRGESPSDVRSDAHPSEVKTGPVRPTGPARSGRAARMRRVRRGAAAEPGAPGAPAAQSEPGTLHGPADGSLASALALTTAGLRVDHDAELGAADATPRARGPAASKRPARAATHQATPAAPQQQARNTTAPQRERHLRTSTPFEETRRVRQGTTASRAPLRSAASGGEQPQLPYPYSFDNFVVGPCNALAREAALAVAGGQGMALAQLYLASAPGLGKTHLARAVATEVARQNARPVRYANAEVFTSEFVGALRNKTTTEFKRRYRPERGGLLVLEDVQFLAAKKATQLEFFHSVQHVLDAGGRVLLTGDRMPQDMDDLDERLREQLARGFVAGLEPPDAIVRRRILKAKAANGAIALPDECLDLLVESVSGNVRELEGVLMQVVTTSTLLKRPIDLELTKRAIAQKVQAVAPPRQRPEVGDVLAVVASFFKTTPDMLAARSRRRAVLVPRQLAMYLCHRHTDAPLAEIGRALDRDHPSVRNAIKKVEREMLENPRLRYQVEALATRIQERMQ